MKEGVLGETDIGIELVSELVEDVPKSLVGSRGASTGGVNRRV